MRRGVATIRHRIAIAVLAGTAAALLVLGPIAPGELWVIAALAALVLAHRLLYAADFDPGRLLQGVRVLRAMRRGEIVMHYQPKLSLTTGELVAVEALARWQHRRLGLLLPADWIAGAELPWTERRFTRHTLDVALAQAHRWREQDDLDVVVCVNVAPACFADPRFPDDLGAAMSRAGVRSEQVQIELTELTLDLSADVLRVADALNEMGVALSLDDFGVGHSSLDRLAQLPLSELKIDRRFVRRQTTSTRDAAIVRGSIDLGKALGLDVTAEGVETFHDVQILHRHACDIAQGFYFSAALPADEVPVWNAARHRAPIAV